HPALLVAYPKSFTPSVVSWRSWPVATSFTQRFQSQMKRAFVPSGDIDGGGGVVMPVTLGPQVLLSATPPPRPAPPRPPPAPRPPVRPPPRPPAPPPAASAPAGGVATTSRVFFTGSTTTFSVPVNVVRTYQKRPSGSQLASAVPPTTRPLSAGASILTARS